MAGRPASQPAVGPFISGDFCGLCEILVVSLVTVYSLLGDKWIGSVMAVRRTGILSLGFDRWRGARGIHFVPVCSSEGYDLFCLSLAGYITMLPLP